MSVTSFRAPFAEFGNEIKISMPKPNEPDGFTFKMHKSQGDSEKGLGGYIDMLATNDAIIQVIKYMKENHRDFLINSYIKYNNGMTDQASPTALVNVNNADEFNFFETVTSENESIKGNQDSIKINHKARATRLVPKKTLDLDNLSIKISKWQGDDVELGQEGMLRLISLNNTITRAASSLNLTFKGIHKDAQKIMGEPDKQLQPSL